MSEDFHEGARVKIGEETKRGSVNGLSGLSKLLKARVKLLHWARETLPSKGAAQPALRVPPSLQTRPVRDSSGMSGYASTREGAIDTVAGE
jgi:hypothetical protein